MLFFSIYSALAIYATQICVWKRNKTGTTDIPMNECMVYNLHILILKLWDKDSSISTHYLLQVLLTLTLHFALSWRQLPFIKYSRCMSPSRSEVVLSCPFFGEPEPMCLGDSLKLRNASLHSYSSAAPELLSPHNRYNIFLSPTYHYRSRIQLPLWLAYHIVSSFLAALALSCP
jgi:hypothetical protein